MAEGLPAPYLMAVVVDPVDPSTGRKINYQQRVHSGKGGTPPTTSSTYDGGIGGGGGQLSITRLTC